jgi:hypothetical protein
MPDNWKPNRSFAAKQGVGTRKQQRGEKAVNKSKIDHGTMDFFKEGGTAMATKGVNPFAKFEKSAKDKEVKGKGKEGSKKEEFFDRMQGGMKCGGGVKKYAKGGGVELRGKTVGKQV